MRFLLMPIISSILLAAPSFAMSESHMVTLVLKDHRFEPSEVRVPAGTKIELTVSNQDDAKEEFDSYDLDRELFISPGSQEKTTIGPLKPGRYHFVGENNSKTARGVLIAE